MKKYLLMLSLMTAFGLAACTGPKASESLPPAAAATDPKVEVLEKENRALKRKIRELEKTHAQAEEQLITDMNDASRLWPKVLKAMFQKDYDYLQSVAGPNVKITKGSSTVSTDKYGDVTLLNPFPLKQLEFRAYIPLEESENEIQIALASVYPEHGATEIYIDFIKTAEGWKYNGHITN